MSDSTRTGTQLLKLKRCKYYYSPQTRGLLISRTRRLLEQLGIRGTDQLNRRSKEMMFPVLIEEAVGPNGKGHALIFMREDGEFEGLVLRKERATELDRPRWERRIEDYELCVVAESLSTGENYAARGGDCRRSSRVAAKCL